jgi:tetratricopeptide (TPR) repeat protein
MAHLDIESLLAAVRDLVRGGRWATARDLLAAVEPANAHDAGAIAVAAAEAEVDQAFFTRRAPDETLLATARDRAADSAQAWTADFAQLRASYAAQLFTKFSGATPDSDELAAEADRLAGRAPGPAARAYVTFYQGLIAGVLRDDDDAAEAHWQAALDTDDEYVRSYALRHLGWVADEAGRRDEALELWRESTRLRQRAGFVPGVLAQLVVQEGGATPVVAGWADALGIAATIAAVSATEPEVARDPA